MGYEVYVEFETVPVPHELARELEKRYSDLFEYILYWECSDRGCFLYCNDWFKLWARGTDIIELTKTVAEKTGEFAGVVFHGEDGEVWGYGFDENGKEYTLKTVWVIKDGDN